MASRARGDSELVLTDASKGVKIISESGGTVASKSLEEPTESLTATVAVAASASMCNNINESSVTLNNEACSDEFGECQFFNFHRMAFQTSVSNVTNVAFSVVGGGLRA